LGLSLRRDRNKDEAAANNFVIGRCDMCGTTTFWRS